MKKTMLLVSLALLLGLVLIGCPQANDGGSNDSAGGNGGNNDTGGGGDEPAVSLLPEELKNISFLFAPEGLTIAETTLSLIGIDEVSDGTYTINKVETDANTTTITATKNPEAVVTLVKEADGSYTITVSVDGVEKIAAQNATKHIPVTGINGVIKSAVVNVEQALTDSAFPTAPDNASSSRVVWSLKSGTATIEEKTIQGSPLSQGILTATVAGDVVVTATVYRGKSATENYTQDFTITVTELDIPMVTVEPMPNSDPALNGKTLFKMGNDDDYDDDENPARFVHLDDFMIGETEVTQGQWTAIMGTSRISALLGNLSSNFREEYGKSTNHPAYYVTYYHAVAFCNVLSTSHGLEPVYYTEDGSTRKYITKYEADTIGWFKPDENPAVGWNSIYIDWSRNGYRLPTEAEWEYAAGATGETVPGESWHEKLNIYAGTDNVAELGNYAVYSNNHGALDPTTPTNPTKSAQVKSKLPNYLGLYDMSGNVAEWCWDGYDADYYRDSASTYPNALNPHVNPKGPSSSYRNRSVVRGGAWSSLVPSRIGEFDFGGAPGYSGVRVSERAYMEQETGFDRIGFRVARNVE